MQKQRVEFAQRHEDEPALMHARMRHHEIRFVDHLLAVKQYVQIDGPGARSIVLITAERMFNLSEYGQEAFRCDIGFKLYDAVQEPATTGIGMIVHWFGFIEERHAHDV